MKKNDLYKLEYKIITIIKYLLQSIILILVDWSMKILNNEERKFNLTFTPDYLEIINNSIGNNKMFLKEKNM